MHARTVCRRRATISAFKGRHYVDVREWYSDAASGAPKPGKKGISLGPDQWARLVAGLPALAAALAAAAQR